MLNLDRGVGVGGWGVDTTSDTARNNEHANLRRHKNSLQRRYDSANGASTGNHVRFNPFTPESDQGKYSPFKLYPQI